MALEVDQGIQALDPTEDILLNPYEDLNPPESTGQSVQIFKNPLLKEGTEGTATVDEILMSDGQQDLALVTLDSNGLKVQRWIKKTYVNGKFPYTLPFKLR